MKVTWVLILTLAIGRRHLGFLLQLPGGETVSDIILGDVVNILNSLTTDAPRCHLLYILEPFVWVQAHLLGLGA